VRSGGTGWLGRSESTRGGAARGAAVGLALLAGLGSGCLPQREDHLAKASRFLADGKLDDAAAEYRVALRDSPRPAAELLWKLGLLNLDAKNLTEARSLLARLVDLDAGSRARVADAYLLFAARWFKAGDPFSAIQAIEAARATDPDRNLGPYYYEVGDYYFELPDYERAVQEYLLAIAMAPGIDREAVYRLALAQERLGRWAQAVKHFRAYAEAAPPERASRELRYHLGEAAYRAAEAAFLAHDYGEALDYLRNVLDTGQPESRLDDAYYLLGELRYRRGDVEGAEAAFEKVLELSPSSSSRLYGEAERRLLDIRIGGPT
jgi:tetratricopeptide (TPR) repeat protein